MSTEPLFNNEQKAFAIMKYLVDTHENIIESISLFITTIIDGVENNSDVFVNTMNSQLFGEAISYNIDQSIGLRNGLANLIENDKISRYDYDLFVFHMRDIVISATKLALKGHDIAFNQLAIELGTNHPIFQDFSNTFVELINYNKEKAIETSKEFADL